MLLCCCRTLPRCVHTAPVRDLQSTTDPSTCGTACNALVNCTANLPDNVAAAVCAADTCAVGSCVSTFLDCNSNYADGCEVVSAVRCFMLLVYWNAAAVLPLPRLPMNSLCRGRLPVQREAALHVSATSCDSMAVANI
jgi:hypothetical protein